MWNDAVGYYRRTKESKDRQQEQPPADIIIQFATINQSEMTIVFQRMLLIQYLKR
jgi:hypothetical protein